MNHRGRWVLDRSDDIRANSSSGATASKKLLALNLRGGARRRGRLHP
jgi:hypothetical protein